MSKDSSFTCVHFHNAHHADLFEEFNRPYNSPTAAALSAASTYNGPSSAAAAAVAAMQSAAAAGGSSHLPVEEIYIAPQYQPINPEDEDDVVPDQHAAFGISRAMDPRPRIVWRDFALDELARGVGLNVTGPGTNHASGRRVVGSGTTRRVVCLR